MTTLEILGTNRLQYPQIERVGCRGIIIQNLQILLVHELKTDFYMIPGGGWEFGETLEECCVRELREETGYVVKSFAEGAFLQLNEYYGEYLFVDYYFNCEIVGNTITNLTEAEADKNLIAEWVDLHKAVEIFSHHNDFDSIFEEKRGAYLREYTALQEYNNFYSLEVR
jgi:8-oxo-dGTP pyrophosphatase MutT (NUDIX family)